VYYTLKWKTPPAVLIDGTPVPQSNKAKYLGVIVDRRLNFSKQVSAIRVRIRAAATKHLWLIDSRSKLSLSNKVTIHKQIIAPIWRYGCQIWSLACDSQIRRIQAAHNKIARTITGCEWYVRNTTLHKDLKLATVFEAINMHSSRYHDRLERHSNRLAKARHCPELAHQEGSTEDGRRTSSYGPPSQEPGDDDDLLIVIMLIVIFVLLFCTANSC